MGLFDKAPVTMGSEHAELLISEIVKRVVASTKDSNLEELRSFVRLESDLTETRRLSAIKDGEIAQLRAYVDKLHHTISTLAPAAGHQALPLPLATVGINDNHVSS